MRVTRGTQHKAGQCRFGNRHVSASPEGDDLKDVTMVRGPYMRS
jgi:hypothetical protein